MIYKVPLTDADLDRLDGACSPEAQAAVNTSKARRELTARLSRLTDKQAAAVGKIVERARSQGELTHSRVSLNSCPACDVAPGYAARKRGTRYHDKGSPDYSKPRSVSGVDYGRGFVTVTGHVSVGCCNECDKVIFPAVQAEIATMPTAVPAWFPGSETFTVKAWGGDRTMARLVRHTIQKCKACGLVQHEGEMGTSPTIMGDGSFPSTCRGCGSKRAAFGPNNTDKMPGWVVWDAMDRKIVRVSDDAGLSVVSQ